MKLVKKTVMEEYVYETEQERSQHIKEMKIKGYECASKHIFHALFFKTENNLSDVKKYKKGELVT